MYYNKLRLIYTKPLEDAEAYFAAAGITSTTEKDAYNAFVSGLKSDGVYSKLVTFHPFLGSNLTSKAYNAINPSTGLITFFNMTSVSGGVRTGTGGGNAQFTTPSSGVTANNAGFGAYSTGWSSIVSPKTCYIGKVGSVYLYVKSSIFLYSLWNTTNNYILFTMNKLISIQATTISVFNYATSIYHPSGQINAGTSINTSVPTGAFSFGDVNATGSDVTFGCHYTSLGLTSVEHALLNTRINTLMTAVGR